MPATEQLEQVRERILESAREIEEFSQLPLPRDQFFRRFIKLLVRALGARGGIVWMRGDNHRLTPVADEALEELEAMQDARFAQRNEGLLSDVISTGQARCIATYETEAGPEDLPYVVVVAPLHAADECVGVVEVMQRDDSPLAARSGYLQFVEQMSGHASRFLSRMEASQTAPDEDQRFWHEFSNYTLALQSSLDFHQVAGTAANDGRLLLDCDRVSITRTRGKKTVVEAISGQDRVNHRANLVCALEALAERVTPAGETFLYDGHVDGVPPQLEAPLADYVAESNSRMILMLPLCVPEERKIKTEKERQAEDREERRETFGCLIVEQMSEGEPQPALIARAELAADHVAAALSNARSHQEIFLLPLWEFLGGCREWFYGRKLLKTALFLAALLAVTLGLTVVPWDYRVAGEGRLMPVEQREVFAPWDGEAVEIHVVDGQRVKRGDVLVQLRNDELHSRLSEVRNSLREKQQERRSLAARIEDAARDSNREAQLRLRGELVDTEIQLRGLQSQEKIMARREAALTVRSPIDGVVASFQIERLLKDRPVQRGELLLQVMDDSGEWRLELDVEEHRMGHLLEARSSRDDGRLAIEFVPATSAEVTYRGELTEVSTRPSLHPEKGSVVRVIGSVDEETLPERRIGAEVRAKIDCGQKSLGYVLFGDVVEFVQQRLWL